ncbi:Serine/Threonine-Protein Kinase N3 [Manis pentadactyla]|nr:Serine/Threonine-Protein Kinase N3 [Manis pentadactyla]
MVLSGTPLSRQCEALTSGGDWLRWRSQLEFDNLESKRLELAVELGVHKGPGFVCLRLPTGCPVEILIGLNPQPNVLPFCK